MFSSAPLWQRLWDLSGPHGAEEPLKAGDNLREEGTAPFRGEFAVLRFIRHLLYLLGAAQELGAWPHKPTFWMCRLEVRVLCPHRKERWAPGHLEEVRVVEALKPAHDLA